MEKTQACSNYEPFADAGDFDLCRNCYFEKKSHNNSPFQKQMRDSQSKTPFIFWKNLYI